ncbi:MAG: hypothetical protein HND44_04910 [Chloroflexi bacterium]|nr:hypothetical protein [Ardenticatenaceae bacterium]NOG33904.1 hypothetical protein [Chloroflexota bacterium]GIK54764.1 MAG: hypothetical protein BroJett015_04270 [Chloroflexota bacterium]
MKLPYLGAHNPMLTQLQQRQARPDSGFYQPPSPGTGVGSTRFHFQQPVPSTLKGHDWLLQPLQMGNAALTYEAYLTNPDAPMHHNGRHVTDQPYTWRDHMERVERAEQEHCSHKQFSFAVLTTAQDKCLGCVHLTLLRPFLIRYQAPDHLLTGLGENSAMILFWFCRSYREQPFSDQILQALHQWLTQEWELDDCLFRVHPADVTAVHALQAAGLQRRFWLDAPIMPTPYDFYGD